MLLSIVLLRVITRDWYYFGVDGVALTGLQKIGQQTLYFDQDGKQVKGSSSDFS